MLYELAQQYNWNPEDAFEGIESLDFPVKGNTQNFADSDASTGEEDMYASDQSEPLIPVVTLGPKTTGEEASESQEPSPAVSDVVLSGGTRQERMQVARALQESLLASQQTEMPLTQPPPEEDTQPPAGVFEADDFPRIKAISGKKTIYDRGVFCAVSGGCRNPTLNETLMCRHSNCSRQIHHVCYVDFCVQRARRGEILAQEKQYCKYHK